MSEEILFYTDIFNALHFMEFLMVGNIRFHVSAARDSVEHMGFSRSRSVLCHPPVFSVTEYTLSGCLEHGEGRRWD